MALIVEDGTGRADAQSFVDVVDIAAWASARGLSFSGTAPQQEQSAVRAFDYIRNGQRFRRWRGALLNGSQRGPYPRTGVTLEDGTALVDAVIPWQIKDAQCALAVLDRGGTSLQTIIKNGGAMVSSKSVGPLSTSYAVPTNAGGGAFSLASEAIFSEAIGYLVPLLQMEFDRAEVSYEVPEVPENYVSATFNNNS